MPSQFLSSTLEGVKEVPSGELVIRAMPVGECLAFSLVVPTLNESRNLEELVELLTPVIISQVGDSYEIIVVDDDSPDGTWQVAEALAARDPHVIALRRMEERGLATAVVRGWQAARGNLLGVIDADLQHPPEVTARLLEAMQCGPDLAVASREVEGGGTSDWSFVRLLISRGLRAMGKLLLPNALGMVTDPMAGFFVVRRSAIQDVVLKPCGYKILLELLVRARAENIVEVGYVFRSRQHGDSKATLMVLVDYVRHLLRLRATIPGLPKLEEDEAAAASRD